MKRLILAIMFFLPGMVLISCSNSGNSNPTSDPIAQSDNSQRMFLGYYTVNLDTENNTGSITPDRSSAEHLNVKQFLLGWPCGNCLKIKNLQFLPNNIVECDIEVTHPVAMLVYTVFDLRVIAIFPQDDTFYGIGVSYALQNRDGLTTLWDKASISGYINGYKAYNKGEARRPFSPGDVFTEHFVVKIPSGPFAYDIAVDASWAPNDGVTFPINMNSAEAIDLTGQVSPGLTDTGGSATITAQMYDYQGTDTIASVKAYSDKIFSAPISLAYVSGNGFNATYSATITNSKRVSPGTYKIIVQATDDDDVNSPYDISSYVVLDATVVSTNVTVTLAEDDNSKTIGNYYNFDAYLGTINTGTLNYLDNDGPWDFTALTYNDTAQKKILSPTDIEVAYFMLDYPTAEHYVKNDGNFGFSPELYYQPEKHDYAKNKLVPLGFYESYTFGGSYAFTGTIDGFPYPYTTSTSFNRTYKSGSMVTVQYNTQAQGIGACKVPLNSGTVKPALKMRTVITAKIFSLEIYKNLVYEWIDDDGNTLAIITASNITDEPSNWNTSTYAITGSGEAMALKTMYRQ